MAEDVTSKSYVYPVRSLLNGTIQPSIGRDYTQETPLHLPKHDTSSTSTGTRRATIPKDSHSLETTGYSPPSHRYYTRHHRHSSVSPDFRHHSTDDNSSNKPFSAFIDPCLPEDLPPTTGGKSPVITPSPPDNDLGLPFNPSEYGIVHLPPLPELPLSTIAMGEADLHGNSRIPPLNVPSSGSSSGRITNQEPTSYVTNCNPISRPQSLSGSEPSSPDSEYFSVSSNSNSELAEPFVTFRYEHAQDENGHHVVIGREGQLQRCEDEPIRTPGAVQAFGVLIAVQETNGTLVVRQVSENSTELLGLSPRFLFSLKCFTDTLPGSQADLLWDKIQFLVEHSDNFEGDIGESPHVFLLSGWGEPGTEPHEINGGQRSWTCWCAIHRSRAISNSSDLIILEFEWETDTLNPLYPPGKTIPSLASPTGSAGNSYQTCMDSVVDRSTPSSNSQHSIDETTSASVSHAISLVGTMERSPNPDLDDQEDWVPSAEEILESTTSYSKPLPSLERLRNGKASALSNDANTPTHPLTRMFKRKGPRAGGGNPNVGMMDVFAALSEINEQLGAVTTLDIFLKVVVGVLKDLTQFHRILVYQFDEAWNGEVVAELVDWSQTKDLYRGLHFPASDIPAQARALYAINKVRLLYDRSQPTARIVIRSKEDLETPLDMTHCYLRAMSPIHIQYLTNMGVRASMSVSIMAFGVLWGLITCHSYGSHGMRVSFPIRQMLRLLSQSISKNIERLIYAQRLHTRQLADLIVSGHNHTEYILKNTDDLLSLFDADFGILVIGEGAKILGPNQHGQEILIMAEYLRLKQFNTIQVSQAITSDFRDLQLTAGLQVIAGLLLIPLSGQGTDFIAFLRKGQSRDVKWAGKPYKDGTGRGAPLEPRRSFKTWTETVAGRCRAWTDEQLETAGVLALVYGKFIEVWREKENALQTTRLTNILLSNASHEVRTPLNHIINYLEMALNGPLDAEVRHNLSHSHAASKNLLFTINDLLDLTRLESGNASSFSELFDLRRTIKQATHLYKKEAKRRDISFVLELDESPRMVIGDPKKIQTVVQNLTANSLRYTSQGSITVRCSTFGEPGGLRGPEQTAVEIVVIDTGCGIPSEKLEHIFKELERVESSEPFGVGLGLAVVARIAEQLGGQLRVDSKVDEGSQFSFLIPLTLSTEGYSSPRSISSSPSSRSSFRTRTRSSSLSQGMENLVDALVRCSSASPSPGINRTSTHETYNIPRSCLSPKLGSVEVAELGKPLAPKSAPSPVHTMTAPNGSKLRILIVEDNDINRKILAKRLRLDGHTVVNTTNGQEGLDEVKLNRSFDVILMDIQMPILNGFDATREIREVEKANPLEPSSWRLSHRLNGRIPIFAVSASLLEAQHDELLNYGMDGWILKPIDFRRLGVILKGVTESVQRQRDLYHPGCNWEMGGWFRKTS